MAGGSRGNPGFLSNESSFQLRGQCDNICVRRIFQQEGPPERFTGKYLCMIAHCRVRKFERLVTTSCLGQVYLTLIIWCITPRELHTVKLEESAQQKSDN